MTASRKRTNPLRIQQQSDVTPVHEPEVRGPASIATLHLLHRKVLDALIVKLSDPDSPARASTLSVARAFLRDNGINAEGAAHSPTASLHRLKVKMASLSEPFEVPGDTDTDDEDA